MLKTRCNCYCIACHACVNPRIAWCDKGSHHVGLGAILEWSKGSVTQCNYKSCNGVSCRRQKRLGHWEAVPGAPTFSRAGRESCYVFQHAVGALSTENHHKTAFKWGSMFVQISKITCSYVTCVNWSLSSEGGLPASKRPWPFSRINRPSSPMSSCSNVDYMRTML